MELICFLLLSLVVARPKLFDRTKINFDQPATAQEDFLNKELSDDNGPKISKDKLSRTSSYMLTDVTPCGRTIVHLLYNKNTRVKDSSYVIVSNDAGNTYKEYTKADFDEQFEIDDFVIDNYIYLYSYRKRKVYLFDYSFNLILKTKPVSTIREFFIHPLLRSLQANIDDDYKLYLTVDSGESWKYRGSAVESFAWIYDNTGDYLIMTNTSTKDLLFQKVAQEAHSSKLKTNALKIIQQGNLTFAIYKEKGKYVVGLFTSYNYVQKLFIPTNYDIIDFSVSYNFGPEYMVLATLSDGSTTLYQGNLRSFKFVNLLSKVKSLPSDNFGRCYDVAYFEKIPGFILANAYGFGGFNDYSTLISFNHGSKWQRVKVGIYTEGKPATECHMPSCSFKLHFDCTFKSHIKHEFQKSDLAPYILVSQADYKVNDKAYSGIFVSSDAGYTWHLSLKGKNYPGMINEGGVIFAAPRITYSVYYSMSEGKNWSSIRSDYGSYIISAIGESNSSRTKYRLIGASFFSWYIYTIDFTQILKRECLSDDYTLFKPSSSSITHCFMGKKYALYRKKQDSVCKNTLEKMTPVDGGICPCSKDDFGCNYGHKMVNGLCIKDAEAENTNNPWKWCWPGMWISTLSPYASISYDTCDKTKYNLAYARTICGLTTYNDFVAFINGVRLGFFDFTKLKLQEVKLPATFTYPLLAGTFTIDVSGGCIYYLTTKVVVRRSCWTEAGVDLKPSDELYSSDRAITFLDFDPVGLNLVYSEADDLNIRSVLTGKTKIISQPHTKDISFIRVVSEEGFILLGQHNTNLINKIFFNGTLIQSYKFSGVLITGAYDNVNKKIYGLTSDGLYTIVGTSIVKTIVEIPPDTKDLQFLNGKIIFVTSKGVYYDGKLYELKSLQGIFVKNSTSYLSDLCNSLACGDICVPTSSDSAICLCPNNMELVGRVCKCKSSNPDCLKCKDNEFTCDEGECISNLKRCDGYTDCKNGADEYDCKIKCVTDQFSCTSEAKCISIYSVCDGILDCFAGEDELGCKPITNCTDKEFTCNNKVCIPIEKKCDKKNDCGDNSDEEKCSDNTCEAQEFTCNDNSCIPLAAVCNNNMDCSNWEDETGCHSIREYNSTCYFRCSDGTCITKDKVCNREADCSDGYDELFCGYSTECSTGTIACKNTKECILESEKCDGKYDCSDLSDERNCQNKEYECIQNFSFQCVKTRECIPLSWYCDSIIDCADNSDETGECYKFPKIWYIFSTDIGERLVNISWLVKNQPKNAEYNFEIYYNKKRPPVLTRKLNTNSIVVENLLYCQTYFVKVEIVGHHKSANIMDFKVRPRNPPKVEDAVYSGDSVKWKPVAVYCISKIYEVECRDGYEIKFRNFTQNPIIKVSSNTNCYVRTCPFKAVGPFCSDEIQVAASSSSGMTAAIVICVLILIAIIIGIAYFVYRRYGHRFFGSYKRIIPHSTDEKAHLKESEESDDEIEI